MVSVTEPQQRLLAAIDAHRLAPVRVTWNAQVRVGGRLYPLADLYVLRALKLVRQPIELRATPVSMHRYVPTEAGERILDALRADCTD